MDSRTKTAGIGTTLLVLLSTLGCAHGLELRSIGSGAAPASRYVTFFVLHGNTSGSPEADRQLDVDVEATLVDKGLVGTSPEEAEAIVVVHRATPAQRSREAFYRDWGGWAWRLPDVRSTTDTEQLAVGSVVVDIFDAWTKKLVWHGFTRHAMPSGAKNESPHALKKAVTTMFADFPSADGSTYARTAGVTRRAVTAPMSIIFSPRPALLVEIDGEPRYEDVEGTELQRIVNANTSIIRDETGMHYLRIGQRWLEAYDVIGPWSVAGTVPEGANVALQAAHEQRSHLFDATSSDDSMPAVFVTTAPAALIVTDGEPEYVPVNGTSLLRIRNTSALVFREPTDKELYVHVPSGWFRAWTTNGPWQPVLDADLPTDLAGIARSSGSVRDSR